MRKLILLALAIMTLSLVGCATTTGTAANEPYVEVISRPVGLPEGGYVDELWKASKDGKSIIGIKGVKVLRVEIYGVSLDYAQTEQQGEWTVFTLERGQRFNFVFISPKDGQYHYALVSAENNEVPPPWLGRGIAVTRDYGMGSSMTAREFLRK